MVEEGESYSASHNLRWWKTGEVSTVGQRERRQFQSASGVCEHWFCPAVQLMRISLIRIALQVPRFMDILSSVSISLISTGKLTLECHLLRANTC